MSNPNENFPAQPVTNAPALPASRRDAALAPIFYQRDRLQNVLQAVCHFHPELPPQFICPECGNSFCQHCANRIGVTNASECQICGALCRAYPEVRAQVLILVDQYSNFGKSDLIFAGRYARGVQMFPILLFTIFFCLNAFGFTFLMAMAILFSYTSYILKDVANGNNNGAENYDFSSILTDLVNPLVVGAGTMLVTFGPLVLIGKYLTMLKILWPLALCWALFYYPIALGIGGITNSFTAVINPLLGITTIRQLGRVYWQCFGYYLVMMSPMIWFNYLIFSHEELITSSIFMLVLAAISGVPLFCITMIVAALLGRAFFKNADRLGLAIKPR